MKRLSFIKSLLLFSGGSLVPFKQQINRENIENNLENPKDGKELLISDQRPRLYIRADESQIGRGLTLSGLRKRVKDPEYKEWASYEGEARYAASLPNIAMQYLLHGNKEDVQRVYSYLKKHPMSPREYTSYADDVYNSAIAFDWIRDALTDKQAENIMSMLIVGAEHLKHAVIKPSVNHNYTHVSMYGVTAVALAIYGEGEKYTAKAHEYMQAVTTLLEGKGKLLDTYKAKKGTWTEGNHYTPYVVYHTFLMTLRAISTATNRDYFNIIRNRYDNFIAPMSKYVIANTRPDFTLERIGDVTKRVIPSNTFLRPTMELMASELNFSTLQGQVRSYINAMEEYYGEHFVSSIYNWMMMTLYDSRLPDTPSYKTLPRTMRLGEGTYEHIMFRSQWGINGTLITYVSGWQFTDHQHFDKGSFLIYKKGGLTVDGGGYSSMYRDSWANYSTRTLAHNEVIVHNRNANPFQGIKTKLFPDGGQRVLRKIQNQTTWQKYLKVNKEKGLNTAKVLAFDSNEKYDYVKSDLTNAYHKDVTSMERQLLYFPLADFLVVKDLVISKKASDKYWLLHFEQKPSVDGQIPDNGVNEYDKAEIVSVTRTGELDLPQKTIEYSGKLFIKPILPVRNKISIIGGKDYKYYNRFYKKNFPPKKPFPPYRESGNWRMGASPKSPEKVTTFINALDITDTSKKEMVPTKHIKSYNGKMEGVQFLTDDIQYIGLFAGREKKTDQSQNIDFPVKYRIESSAPAIHVLTELEPDKEVFIKINDRSKEAHKVNNAGVLHFKDYGTGKRNIQITA